MRITKILLLLPIICLLLLFKGERITAEKKDSSSFVVILANQLSYDDIKKLYQSDKRSLLTGLIPGLMNIRTASSFKDIHNLITVNSGVRGIGLDNSRKTISPAILGKESVEVPFIQQIDDKNKRENTGSVPGSLGEELKRRGIERIVLGNSDSRENPDRLGPLLTMDLQGKTPIASIGKETVAEDATFPGGVRTNYPYLTKKALEQIKRGPSFLVIELGDLSRIGKEKSQREKVVKEIFTFVQGISQALQQGDELLVFSPVPSNEALKEKKSLSPVLLWAGIGSGEGVLQSDTTRHQGIVANIDLAPTILAWGHIPQPTGWKGHAIVTVVQKDPYPWLFQEGGRIFQVYKNRTKILYPYAMAMICAIVLSFLLLILKGKRVSFPHWIGQLVQRVLLALLVVPPLLLVEPLFPPLSPGMLPGVLVGTIIFVLVGLKVARLGFAASFLILAFAGWIPVLLDGISGATLMSHSYLGYDPIIGARYYGIGNEYMGAVLGSVLLSLSLLADRWLIKTQPSPLYWWLFFLLFGFWILYMAWPTGGSKAGGLLVFLGAFAVMYGSFSAFTLSEKKTALMVVGTAFAGVFLLVVNARVSSAFQSHVGQAMGDLLQGNWQEVGRIASRKFEMNIRLLQVSPWGKVFLAMMAATAYLVFRRKNAIKILEEESPYFIKGIRVMILVSFMALGVNDSGILAASLVMVYAMVPLYYRLLFL